MGRAAMKNLQQATERICELKGNLVALDALVSALIGQWPAEGRADLLKALQLNIEVARTVLLNAPVSELTVAAFEHDTGRMAAYLASGSPPPAAPAPQA